MCRQSRPRATDPAVNPAQSSGPAVLNPLGATPRVLNASRIGAPAPEDAPEAASALRTELSGSPVPPGPEPPDLPGGHVGSPGPGCRRIQGGTWLRCAALRPPGPRSVCPAGPSSPRPGRVSAPPRFPHTLIWSGPGRHALLQLWRHLAAVKGFARRSRHLRLAHLGWVEGSQMRSWTRERGLFTGSPSQMWPRENPGPRTWRPTNSGVLS